MKLIKLSEDVASDPIEYASNVLADRGPWYLEIPPYTTIKFIDTDYTTKHFKDWAINFLMYYNNEKLIEDGLKAIENANLTTDIYNSPNSLFYKLIDQTSNKPVSTFHDDDEFAGGGNFVSIKVSSDKVFSTKNVKIMFGKQATNEIRGQLESIKPTLRKEFLEAAKHVELVLSRYKR